MNIGDVMTAPAVTVPVDASFTEIVEALLAHGISGLPVVDEDGRLAGIVTEADLISKEAYGSRRRRALELVADYFRGQDPQWVRKAAGRTARDVMTADVTTTSPDDDITAVARRMVESHYKRLPVVKDGRVVGIVSRHDLLRPFYRDDAEITADIARVLDDPLSVPETHRVEPSVAGGIVRLDGTVQWPHDRVLVEALIRRIPGVVSVDNDLEAREPQPGFDPPIYPVRG